MFSALLWQTSAVSGRRQYQTSGSDHENQSDTCAWDVVESFPCVGMETPRRWGWGGWCLDKTNATSGNFRNFNKDVRYQNLLLAQNQALLLYWEDGFDYFENTLSFLIGNIFFCLCSKRLTWTELTPPVHSLSQSVSTFLYWRGRYLCTSWINEWNQRSWVCYITHVTANHCLRAPLQPMNQFSG